MELKEKTFKVWVLSAPTRFEMALGTKQERKQITIKGYTLKDAKKKAGLI